MAVDLEYYGVPPADYREQELRNTVTTSAGQTTISAPYSVGYVDVYFNGAKLDTTEFTATDGANVVLAAAASAGDIVQVISRAQVQIANVYTQQQVNALLIPYFGTSTGTGNAQVLVTTPTFTSFVDGMDIKVRTVGQNSSTTPTITCNGLASKTIVSNNAGGALYGSDWVAGSEITLRYNQTLDKLVLIDGATTAITPAQFDASNQQATSAYVQVALGNIRPLVVSVAGTTTLTAAQSGSIVDINSTSVFTVTLPAASTRTGLTYWLNNYGINQCNITAVSGNFNPTGGGAPATMVMPAGTSVQATSDGTNWVVFGSVGSATLATSGFQRMSSGLIMQWGQIGSIAANSSVNITYPIVFPNGALAWSVVAGATASGSPDLAGVNASGTGNVKAGMTVWNSSASLATQPGGYLVFGF